MIFYCQAMGCSIGETPIIFTNRIRGTSKISKNEIFKAMQTVGRLFISRLKFWKAKPPQILCPLLASGSGRQSTPNLLSKLLFVSLIGIFMFAIIRNLFIDKERQGLL